MKYFLTEYELNGKTFSSGFYSKDRTFAVIFCEQRGIGEIIIGEADGFQEFTNDIFNDLTSNELIHLVTFCSWISINMGKHSPSCILSDTGTLHEIVHLKSGVGLITQEEQLRQRIKNLVKEVFNFPYNHCVVR